VAKDDLKDVLRRLRRAEGCIRDLYVLTVPTVGTVVDDRQLAAIERFHDAMVELDDERRPTLT
jgi:hypothetical protein